MRQIVRYAAAASFVLLLPQAAWSAGLTVHGTTLVRTEERAAPGFSDQRVAPATQFLGLDLDRMGDGNLSLHLYGWGRVDLAERSTDEGRSEGDLSYAYLQYHFPRANGQVRAGRFFLREGVAAEQLDGVSARTDLAGGFTASLFGGIPVRVSNNNVGSYLVGGRLGFRRASRLEVGISALHEGSVQTGPASDLKSHRQLAGIDLWLYPHRSLELSGRTFYNTATDGLAEQSYLLTLRPLPPLSIGAEYTENRYENYFASTNLRSLFSPDGGRQRAYGATVSYAFPRALQIIGDYRRYNRKTDAITASGGNFTRYGIETRITLLHNAIRSGLSYHRVDTSRSSDLDPTSSYHEARGYAMYDGARCLSSADAIFDFYDDSIFRRKRAYEIIGSLGYKFFPDLILSGDVSYGKNPRLDEEVRGVVRLSFKYTDKGVPR